MNKHVWQVLISVGLLIVLGTATVSAFAEDEGRLTVNSDPTGAEVWVAGKFVGYAPVSTIITGNSMTNMRVEVPGNTYQVWRGAAYVPSGQEVSMNVTVYKKTQNAKEEGIIVVTSDVEGAKVYLDNSYYGSISGGTFSIDKVKLGLHFVEVSMDGYRSYSAMCEVPPKNIGTANTVANLQPLTGTPQETAATAAKTTVPPAPTKSPVGAVISILALLGAATALRS